MEKEITYTSYNIASCYPSQFLDGSTLNFGGNAQNQTHLGKENFSNSANLGNNFSSNNSLFGNLLSKLSGQSGGNVQASAHNEENLNANSQGNFANANNQNATNSNLQFGGNFANTNSQQNANNSNLLGNLLSGLFSNFSNAGGLASLFGGLNNFDLASVLGLAKNMLGGGNSPLKDSPLTNLFNVKKQDSDMGNSKKIREFKKVFED